MTKKPITSSKVSKSEEELITEMIETRKRQMEALEKIMTSMENLHPDLDLKENGKRKTKS